MYRVRNQHKPNIDLVSALAQPFRLEYRDIQVGSECTNRRVRRTRAANVAQLSRPGPPATPGITADAQLVRPDPNTLMRETR